MMRNVIITIFLLLAGCEKHSTQHKKGDKVANNETQVADPEGNPGVPIIPELTTLQLSDRLGAFDVATPLRMLNKVRINQSSYQLCELRFRVRDTFSRFPSLRRDLCILERAVAVNNEEQKISVSGNRVSAWIDRSNSPLIKINICENGEPFLRLNVITGKADRLQGWWEMVSKREYDDNDGSKDTVKKFLAVAFEIGSDGAAKTRLRSNEVATDTWYEYSGGTETSTRFNSFEHESIDVAVATADTPFKFSLARTLRAKALANPGDIDIPLAETETYNIVSGADFLSLVYSHFDGVSGNEGRGTKYEILDQEGKVLTSDIPEPASVLGAAVLAMDQPKLPNETFDPVTAPLWDCSEAVDVDSFQKPNAFDDCDALLNDKAADLRVDSACDSLNYYSPSNAEHAVSFDELGVAPAFKGFQEADFAK